MTSVTTTVEFDRTISLLSVDTSPWSVKVGFVLVQVSAVNQVSPNQVRLTHQDSAFTPRFVSMNEQVVAGEPDGTLAETFEDFEIG